MANYWMHNGFLQVEGQKMTKSDGNFVTINELLETEKFGGRKWPGEVLRLAMLMTHYREPIDFSLRKLEEAESDMAALGPDRDGCRATATGCALNSLKATPNPSPDVVALRCSTISTPRPRSTRCRRWRSPPKPGDRAAADGLIATAAFLGIELTACRRRLHVAGSRRRR